MSNAAATVPGAGSGSSTAAAAGGGNGGGGGGGGASFTECRAVGIVDRPDHIGSLANLLRALCSSYCTHATHTVVFRMPLPAPPGAPPGGTSALVRLSRRLPGNGILNPQGAGSRLQHPFLEDAPERWEVRHEGPPLQGPALNALPAAMREVSDTACFGSGTLDFWKTLGGKLEYEMYRDGNEYSIVFHGHEIKVELFLRRDVRWFWPLYARSWNRTSSKTLRASNGSATIWWWKPRCWCRRDGTTKAPTCWGCLVDGSCRTSSSYGQRCRQQQQQLLPLPEVAGNEEKRHLLSYSRIAVALSSCSTSSFLKSSMTQSSRRVKPRPCFAG